MGGTAIWGSLLEADSCGVSLVLTEEALLLLTDAMDERKLERLLVCELLETLSSSMLELTDEDCSEERELLDSSRDEELTVELLDRLSVDRLLDAVEGVSPPESDAPPHPLRNSAQNPKSTRVRLMGNSLNDGLEMRERYPTRAYSFDSATKILPPA